MISLPVEVSTLIFSLLVQQDQLECMTVCRQWHDVIKRHCFFRVVYIRRQQQFDELVEKVKHDPTLGAKVLRLTVELTLEEGFDDTIFVDLFPNVRDFTMLDLHDDPFIKPFYKTRKRHPWCHQIQKLVETTLELNTVTVLNSGICRNLTYLAVTGHGQNPTVLVKGLTNAPALVELYLRRYVILFDDIELLHQTASTLETLTLMLIEFDFIGADFLRIKPANSVKKFRCDVMPKLEPEASLNLHLAYFSRKYTQLEDLAFEYGSYNDGYWEEDENILRDGPKIDAREVMTSYLKVLAPTLKTLSLPSNTFHEMYPERFDFEMLDECGCQIKRLELEPRLNFQMLELLTETMQVKYIQSLMVKLAFDDDSEGFILLEWLEYFKVLKELTLYFPKSDMYNTAEPACLAELLNSLKENQLETLCLYDVQLDNDNSVKLSEYPSLKNLTLSGVTLGSGTDIFISQVFPNLKRLCLENCFEGKDIFMFPHTNLSYLEVKQDTVFSYCLILVVTLGDNKRRLYGQHIKNKTWENPKHGVKKDRFSLPSFSSKEFDKSDGSPFLTVVCNSVYDFFMMDKED